VGWEHSTGNVYGRATLNIFRTFLEAWDPGNLLGTLEKSLDSWNSVQVAIMQSRWILVEFEVQFYQEDVPCT
jgi:hypothetical protein